MSAHDEAVEAAAKAWVGHASWDAAGEGRRFAWKREIAPAITAYHRHLRAAGFVVTKVPDERDHLDAPSRMSAGEALGWGAGHNACRAATLANAVEVENE